LNLTERVGLHWIRRPAVVVLVAAACLAASEEALGRVGGGHSFSSGSRSSGRSGGYSGGGGGGGDSDLLFQLLYLLFRLCIDMPVVGIPLVLGIVAVIWWASRASSDHVVIKVPRERPAERPAKARAAIEKLVAQDPAFSLPAFEDFTQLIHRRALEATASGAWGPLTPFVSEGAQTQLRSLHPGITSISEVVLANATLGRVDLGDPTRVRVRFSGTRVEAGAAGPIRVYVEERWDFSRAGAARSMPPEDLLRLGCPSCGNAVDTDTMGHCASCGTVITTGALQWQVTEVNLVDRRRVTPMDVGFTNGGAEPGYHARTVTASDLDAEIRRFTGRHPEFQASQFQDRVRHIFLTLQDAWSRNRWEETRPFVTDAVFQTFRFWIDGYKRDGLQNRLADVVLEKSQIVDVHLDAWYESITVRVWARCKDATFDRQGKLVGGNERTDRQFSEYWTFIRSAGTPAKSGDPSACPSCGGPLDKVESTGICGYCGSKITSGRFDWVLSRIEQPEVYEG
jgi:hypothetical protein